MRAKILFSLSLTTLLIVIVLSFFEISPYIIEQHHLFIALILEHIRMEDQRAAVAATHKLIGVWEPVINILITVLMMGGIVFEFYRTKMYTKQSPYILDAVAAGFSVMTLSLLGLLFAIGIGFHTAGKIIGSLNKKVASTKTEN